MNESLKKGDFVEIEYSGRFKENNIVFDTTNAAEAKKTDIFSPKMIYGPVKICIGQKQVLSGLDDTLVNAEFNKESEIELTAEKAFGKKDAKLLKLMPMSQFKQQKIQPMPGLQLNVDGLMAVVRSVSGGRIVVDFNHPFAGKEVIYKFKILRKIIEPTEKIRGYLALILSAKEENIDVKVENDSAIIKLKKELPVEFLEVQKKKILEIIPEIKNIQFIK